MSHSFRPKKLPRRAIEAAARRSLERENALYEDWASYRRHKRVIADAIAAHALRDLELASELRVSLAALYTQAQNRFATIRDIEFVHRHTFDLHPGMNVLGPPYDFTLKVRNGSQKPSVSAETSTGRFSVSATAMAAGGAAYGTRDTAGAAGVGLVIVPSDPSRTLAIRPYFRYGYDFACESHGSPTAHSSGFVSAAVTGHTGSTRFEFPLKDRQLWAAGSDIWDDAHGAGSDVFMNPDAEHIVSGHEYYTVLYSCRCGGDSAKVRIGWWSAAFMKVGCDVPFVAVRET